MNNIRLATKNVILLILCTIFVSEAGDRFIRFGNNGLKWRVKQSKKLKAPGPNYWSASRDMVFVDANKRLHLKVKNVKNNWQCTEVSSQQKFGYGEFTFYVSADVLNFPGNLVAGLFLYQNDKSEIDVELTRWGKVKNNELLNYTIHSKNEKGKKIRETILFDINLHGPEPYMTHKIFWEKDAIRFQSYHGHYTALPGPKHLISDTTISQNDFNLPSPDKKRVIFNLYWYQGEAGSVSEKGEWEIIISDFIYKKNKTFH